MRVDAAEKCITKLIGLANMQVLKIDLCAIFSCLLRYNDIEAGGCRLIDDA